MNKPDWFDYSLEERKSWAKEDITQSFIRQINKHKLDATIALTGCETFEAFRFACGFIEGLGELESIIKGP